MNLFRLILGAIGAVALLNMGLDVSAHQGHSHHATQHTKPAARPATTLADTMIRSTRARTWTARSNGQNIEGSLLLSKDGQLKLEQRDGSVVTIPLRDLQASDRFWAERRLHDIRQLNSQPTAQLLAMQSARRERSKQTKPSIAGLFDPFRKHVQIRFDEQFLYVESDGMPDHPMMIGITAWQQQVPLPQRYTGNNAWRIPLNPVPARQPMSAKTGFFRGAIALAVNGVPIFNPIKNDGRTDTLKAGELDEWGGHCGRADDYHYHATKTYPYLNGGFYGEVAERGGQVDPQPRANGVRPAQRPLRGAKITGFKNPKSNSFRVEYEVQGNKRSISYVVAADGSVEFRFTDSRGTKTEEYQPRQRGGGGGRPRDQVGSRGNQTGPRPDDGGSRPPRGDDRRTTRGGGGGDRLTRVLDSNRDGIIDRAELAKAVESLRSLDRNADGKLTRDELRGERGQRGGRGLDREEPREQSSATTNSRPGRTGSARTRRTGGRLGGYEVPPAANAVPKHQFDIVLGRPTDKSVTARVLAYHDLEGYLAYGLESGKYTARTPLAALADGQPVDIAIDSLDRNTRYFYQLNYRKPEAKSFEHSDEYTFHTQRGFGSPFTFTVQSDSHLDENTSGDVYQRTLANALADSPDFHLALGDTFMTGKYIRPKLSHGQYLAQRYYFGQLCHSAPLFFALGNHDGESGSRGSNIWATQTRKRYIANPFPDGFYSGNERKERDIGLPENYYSWEWGNSQFIVLDPFRHTTSRSRSSANWYRTLGEEQYQWLRTTLSRSQAKFRFVFLHHLIGGADRNSRGGIEAAPFFEWGGKSLDGTYDFDRFRPGWGKPIHRLLVDHGVTIVFHGHDHMYVKQELDGVVYQLVPQPGHPRFGNTRSAREYGYVNGVVLSSSGHIRVGVAKGSVRVDYVRSYLPRSESADRENGDVAHSYLIKGH